MLITIGGKAGSGKSTVSKAIADRLGYQRISIGDMKRQIAEEMGISVQEFNVLGEKPGNEREFDLKYEEYQASLSLNANIILDSRLGFYKQPQAFKVFLDVDTQTAADRIWHDGRSSEQYSSLKQLISVVKERNNCDAERFEKLYGIKLWDHNNYDLVVDTSDKTPEEVIDAVYRAIVAKIST